MRTSSSFLLVLLLAASHSLFAQTTTKKPNPWTDISETVLQKRQADRRIVPQNYRTLQLNVEAMRSLLAAAPLWQTDAAHQAEVLMTLPMPDGSFQSFRVEYAPLMHPDLAAQFPEIRTYNGYGIDDPTAYIRFDLTPAGFHAFVRSGKTSDVFIDPYATGDDSFYISYYKKDFFKDSGWQCHFDEVNEAQKPHDENYNHMAGDCQLRTYMLALACTGEYAAFHGGTTALALAAMNTTMNRVNGVTEIDASITMQLVPNNNLLVYLNANTDPYTNNDGGTMLGQNQTTCDNVIGSANYDIGHVFSTGGGGVAYLGCVCTSSKAGGVTGQSSPIGDPFDIDYVAHEMGHQYGANHTQNNSCQRNAATAMEPGSASTIMGYAGICAPNVQNNSDAYYHAISLQEIGNFVVGGGNSCATKTDVNDAPTAGAGLDKTIPFSTPFLLTGVGTDPNGDPINYCWEQMNNQVATMPPVSTSTTGPAFRSITPSASPNRYFPNITAIVNNQTPTWEVLPSVGRTLNFRVTVRDNNPNGGCTKEDDMVVTVASNSGPFVVTAPNTNVSWPALSTQTVTWNVAGTTAAPVSAANVDIFLSTDGGNTYPITIATATPNDGTQSVTIPNNLTTTARIMVRGSGNIFFDISNTNFTISAAQNGFTVDASPNSQSVCAPANAVYSVAVGATGTFTGNVTLSATGVPAGATASFSVNPVPAPGTSQLTISGTSGVTPGTYNITVTGTSGANSQSETVQLTVLAGAPGTVTLSSPANGATGVSTTPTLTWSAASGATSYELQVATNAGFTNLVVNQTGLTATSYTVTSPLSANTLYHWRARAVNTCGNGAYSSVFTFTTANTSCGTFASTDVPKAISATGTPTVTSILTIAASGTISDVNLLNLNISHTWINDVIVKLKSPTGTEVTLISQICNDQDNFLTNLDDAGAPYSTLPCPPTNNGTYQPLNPLSAFNGQNLNGTWTLTIQDVASQDGGSLNAWSLNICYAGGPPPLAVTATGTNVSCNGGNNGTATANATGGTGSYAYAWSNGGNTQTIMGLAANTYTVTVTSGASTATASVTVTQPAVLNVTVSGVNPTSGNNGSATATPSGGTSPYSYNWSNGGNTQTITGLGAGTYNVTVTDSKGCTKTGSVTLTAGGCNTQTINTQGFETGWGIWTDGGTDCARISNATFANSGTWSIQLRDNTTTSVMSTTNQNLTTYSEITVTFGYYATGFATGEDFWVQLSTNGGSTYTTKATWVNGTNFSNNTHNTGTVTIAGPFTSTTRVRFRADASTDTDNVYIDDVVITGCASLQAPPQDNRFGEAETIALQAGELTVFPNPTGDELTVAYGQTSVGEAKIVVTDLLGRVVFVENILSETVENQQVKLNVGGLQPGNYTLQLFQGREQKAVRFVKI